MRQVICDKIGALEKEISAEKGDFYLFALFCREDAADKWDLVVSSPWLEADGKQSLNYLADKVRAKLNEEELLSLSKIVVLGVDDPVVDAVRKSVQNTRHGRVELENQDFAGVQVAHACISTSTAPAITVRKSAR
jgi:hypothetical protein